VDDPQHDTRYDSTGAAGDDPALRFFERLAHDLRGPLSPLQTAAYLLRRGDVDRARQQDLLEVIDRQTQRLSAMVQEVSDWMRARRDRLVGHRETIAVPMLLELACANLARRVALEVPVELDEVQIDGDAQRLVQMLATLIAYMQTRAERVEVQAASEAGGVAIIIGTSETAWKPGEAEGLFLESQPVPFDEGLGMRLLIADAIARAHGGEIRPCSAAGGATLECRIPAAGGNAGGG
jgi:signal transduction histidine kinase